MRLDKYVAGAAQQSRSDVRRAIQKGLVCVNGAVCRSADAQVPAGAAVTLNGQPLVLQQYVYIMLDKPKGVVSASADKNDVTVVDLVGRAYPRRSLFPAGRLDKTSTGFVLVTDDGAFAHDILAPRRHVPKTYEVLLDTPLTPEMAAGFAAGVRLADGQRLQPAELSPGPDGPCSARVVLRQGVYHQIKRMFGVYGAGVNELRRTAIGGLALGTLIMTIFGSSFNALYLLPKFSELFGMPMDAIIGMGTAINSSIHSVWTLVFFAVVPFNILKGVVVSVITMLLYKHISPILKKN